MRKRKGWTPVVVAMVGIFAALTGSLAAEQEVARWEPGGGLSEPRVIEKTVPAYPEEARTEKVEGVVVLEATITTAGEVTDVQTIDDPDARLTAAAREAVTRWRFEPARDAEGQAVAVRYRVTVAFKLG